MHLDLRFHAAFLFFFFFKIEKHVKMLSVSGPRALCTGPTTSLTSKISDGQCFPVGPVHCSWDPQTFFFTKTFIKNWSHGTIHTYKNYFTTMFLVFSKINGIQTDPKNLRN